MQKSKSSKLVRNAFAALALLLSPVAMYAQCPLCYRAAASAGGRFIEALRFGILILLPAPFIFGGMIAYMAYSRRNDGIDLPDPSPPANPLTD
ncbi:MAG: hypothetical protein WA817_04300 [Candidatus Acidiferrum sp.]